MAGSARGELGADWCGAGAPPMSNLMRNWASGIPPSGEGIGILEILIVRQECFVLLYIMN